MENRKVLSVSKIAKYAKLAYFASNMRILNHNGVLSLMELYIYLQCLIRFLFVNFVCEVSWKVLKLSRLPGVIHLPASHLCFP